MTGWLFLNALQMLIAKIHQPKRAIKVLIADFCADPGVIEFADRNALMLANLLIRKYNKELNLDIELTPEEVLLVKEGLDREVVTYAALAYRERSGEIYRQDPNHSSGHRKLFNGVRDKFADPVVSFSGRS